MSLQPGALRTAIILLAVVALGAPCLADIDAPTLPVSSVDEYLGQLAIQEAGGGELNCEDASGEKWQPFNTCAAFEALRERGCSGYTMHEIKSELRYAKVCKTIKILRASNKAAKHYFDVSSENWWRALPAELIPMPGGMYSDESWDAASKAREALVTGKTLAEISFVEIRSEPGSLAATLATRHAECGDVRDEILLEATLLADFDGDDVAELMLQGYRADQSDSCALGSGNSIGATFTVIVQRDGPDSPIVISDLPKSE